MDQLIAKALDINVVTADEAKQLVRMNELRFSSISVDSFKPGVLSEKRVVSCCLNDKSQAFAWLFLPFICLCCLA